MRPFIIIMKMSKSKPTIITKFWVIQGPVLALASPYACVLGLCVCSYGFLSTVIGLKYPLLDNLTCLLKCHPVSKLHQNLASRTGEGYILCQK